MPWRTCSGRTCCAGDRASSRRMPEIGYVHPFRVGSTNEAAVIRRKIEEFESRVGGEAQKFLTFKAHLPFKFLSDLVRHPRILDAVEDVLGPNLLCWGSSFFQKNARDRLRASLPRREYQ